MPALGFCLAFRQNSPLACTVCVSGSLLEFWTFLHLYVRLALISIAFYMNGCNVKLAWPGLPNCADNDSYGMPLPDLYQGSQHSEVSLVHWLHKAQVRPASICIACLPEGSVVQLTSEQARNRGVTDGFFRWSKRTRKLL